jgi:hypothetical protein
MGQPQLAIVESTQPAAESISQIHSLFGSSRIGYVYDSLDETIKSGILLAAGLKSRHLKLKLSELDLDEKAQLHQAINALEPVIKKLAGRSIKDFK